MARLEQRLAEAEAALSTLAEAVAIADTSVIARDGAILRLVYTFEAVWKACQQLLADIEGIEIGSPNAAIRAARKVGWLGDEDAEAAIQVGKDRNLTVHLYRGRLADEIAERLAGHVAVLRRWLDALKARASETDGGDC